MNKKQHREEKWKVLSSEYLIKRPWLTARREALQIPNGNILPEYYVLEYSEWVNVTAITEDGEFIFVRQYRHGLGEYLTELCAGTCDVEGETPQEAAKRELLEETGYGDGQWKKLLSISANPGTHTNLTHCFLAIGVRKLQDPTPEDSEDLQVLLFSEAEVRKMLFNDELKQALHVAPLAIYFLESVRFRGDNIVQMDSDI